MLFNFEPYETYNVKDMQKYCNEHDIKLLSDFDPDRLTGDWWEEYRTNYKKFDLQFRNKYASLVPMFQEDHEDLAALVTAWRADVEAFLLANDKRFLELWRVNTIADDDAYSLTNNVDYTETYSEEAHTDVEFNKGSQTNTSDEEREYGQQQVDEDKELEYGRHESETTHYNSAYNDSTFTPVDKNSTDDKLHTDTEDNTTTYGAHTDTLDGDYVEGSRKDTTDNDYTKEYELHKVGNMGVQTVDDMLKKHWDNWTEFDFYGFIMEEIAKNLLRGC